MPGISGRAPHGRVRHAFDPGGAAPRGPEKGPERAIEIALRAGLPPVIAAKVDKVDVDYYKARVERCSATR